MKIRSVRPEFFTDVKMSQLSPQARLLYIGLWCIADDEGRGEYLPKMIEGAVFPHDQVDILALLSELIGLGRVVTYEVDGQCYFQIPRFEEYQKPNRKYESRLPAPPAQRVSSASAAREQESSESPVSIDDSGQAVREQRVSSAHAHAGEGEGEGEGDVHAVRARVNPLPGQRALDAWEEITTARLTRSERAKDGARAAEFLQASGLSPDTDEFRRFLEYAKADGTWSVGGWGRAWAKYRSQGESLSDDELQRRYENEMRKAGLA